MRTSEASGGKNRRPTASPKRPLEEATFAPLRLIRRHPLLTVLLVLAVVFLSAFIPRYIDTLSRIERAVPPPRPAEVGERVPDGGAGHISPDRRVTYNCEPPTSGPHWVNPAPWGIYERTAPSETIVHNLEHGGIVIHYKEISPEDLAALSKQVNEIRLGGFNKILVQPNGKLKQNGLALTAWRWLYLLPGYDAQQVDQFIRSHYEGPDAPEAGAP